MNIDRGLAIVIVAVLVFYLRLIILQRQRARQLAMKTPAKSRMKAKDQPPADTDSYRLLSPNPLDRLIAGVGAAAILIGILLYTSLLPFPVVQTYWWVPTALGIVAFSWAFKFQGTG